MDGVAQINSLIDKALMRLRKGEGEAALVLIDEALRYKTPVKNLLYVKALYHLQRGDAALGEECLEAEAASFPGDADVEALLVFLKAQRRQGSEAQQLRRIAFIRVDAIGDNVIAMGTLEFLREHYSPCELIAVCSANVAELYEACPLVSRVVPFDPNSALYNQQYLNRLVSELQSLKIDTAITSVFSPTLLNHLLVIATGAAEKITVRGDYVNLSKDDEESSGVLANYTKIVKVRPEGNEIEHHREFLEGLGIKDAEVVPAFWLEPGDEEYAEKVFREHGFSQEHTVALFAAGQQEFKSSTVFGRALESLGFSVIALGGANHSAINEENCRLANSPYVNLCGKTTIRQSAAVLKKCRLAVGADTGHAHIACALGVPNVILLGGGHFGRFLPYSRWTSAVSLPLSCYMCNWYCRYKESYCISRIDASTFRKAILETLDRPAEGPRVFFQSSFEAQGPYSPLIADVKPLLRAGINCIAV